MIAGRLFQIMCRRKTNGVIRTVTVYAENKTEAIDIFNQNFPYLEFMEVLNP